MRKTVFILVALLFTAGAARADYVVLRSGQRLHITGYERTGDTVRLTVAGGIIEVAAQDVVAIEPEEVFAAAPASPPSSNVPYQNVIRAAARKHGLDAALIASVISAESNFDSRAVSRKQAYGLMQLRPATASRFSVVNMFDPVQNVDAGTRYLKQLLKQYHGNLPLALAAYNAGPQRVERYGGVPPFRETQAYVRRVMTSFQQQQKNKTTTRISTCMPLAFSCPGPSAQ
jgi:soluble lytic murein transglycosylase-like protein